MPSPAELRPVAEGVWELPSTWRAGMRVPIRVFASEPLVTAMDDAVFEQAANVAMLPGIVGASCVMPDAHWGYGFPIGGVAAFDLASGVISPGGIGFDIGCGMRLVLTDLTLEEVRPRIRDLVDRLYDRVPAGVGGTGGLTLGESDFTDLLKTGARWCVRRGYGSPEDLVRTEEGGCLPDADVEMVSARAIARGRHQVGTLGSGNHYLEVQVVRPEDVADPALAAQLGITRPNQVAVMFHCGSRGFGHQVASEYLQSFLAVMARTYGLTVRDRELACAPFESADGRRYFGAMQCAANMSFANRQVILHRVREVFGDVFRRDAGDLGLRLLYDVAHNVARIESHVVDGERRDLLVHRKGATRAFGPGMPGLPPEYAATGQPVIIGGSMETGSYLLTGAAGAAPSFFSTAHGSGRVMSRTNAKRLFRGDDVERAMARRGIYVRAASAVGLAEEAGAAYKDIDAVVASAALAGLSRPVARFTPIGNVKG